MTLISRYCSPATVTCGTFHLDSSSYLLGLEGMAKKLHSLDGIIVSSKLSFPMLLWAAVSARQDMAALVSPGE